jgi:serine/threonine protein kinase/formylglycine-generating enzyme required for sulfatase activity
VGDPSRPADQSLPAEPQDARVDAALHDYLERVDRGETIDPERFVAGHPEIAGELRSLIEAEGQLRKFAGAKRPAGADSNPDTSTRSFALHGQETIAPQAQAKPPGGTDEASRLKEEFGRYRIVRVLGQGAMGTVYLAEDSQLKRQVALKTPHFEKDPTGELLERLYREARAAANLRHANICPVYDVGQIDGTHYISMAYIEGHPLSAFIRANKQQPERQILIVVRKLAQGLQEAHEQKIVHRDLKPANIMVDKRGEPLIMDFGLARYTRPDEDVRLTHSGTLVGTPAYMSPEQVDGNSANIGAATDQYSLGVILYELLTGQLPFRGSMMAVLGQIVTKEAPAPSQSRAGLDPRIDALCQKMMAKNPADRFESLSAVADEMATILRNPAPAPQSSATGKSTAGLTPPAPGPSLTASRAGASQILKSQKQKALTASDLASLEELARKCWARHDYDQIVQLAQRIPEEKRNQTLQSLLDQALAKNDEISYLLVEIEEAVRLDDARTVLKKAEDLLKIKPGHHRALEVQEQFTGAGGSGVVRFGAKAIAQAWGEGGWVPWSVLAFGLAVLGVMSGVIIWWTGRTFIVIKTDDPNIRVEFKGQKAFLTVPGKEKQVTVEAGEGEFTLSYDGLETVTKKFSIKSGTSKSVTVAILDNKLSALFEGETAPALVETEKAKNGGASSGESRGPPQSVSAATADKAPAGHGFVSLFNGKDLTGWKSHPKQPGNWRVKNGVLIGSGEGSERSHLYTDRGDFKDFHLRVEARINDGGNSGLYVRSSFGPAWPAKSPMFPYGYEAQIDSSVDPARTGSLYAGGTVAVQFTDALVPPGQWFTEEVIAQGNRITVKVNGQTTAVYRDEKEISASGHIALQQNNAKTIVEFRKIEIRNLSADAVTETPAVSADGYVSLFSGKNLSGWAADPSQQGAWHVENGLLVGGGPAGASFLYSDRADYKNFRLRIEARLKGDDYTGLWVRTEVPRGDAVSRTPTSGYKVEIREPADRRTPRTGTIWAVTKRPEGGPSYNGFDRKEPMIEPERWFTLEVVAQGKRVYVLVNGESAVITNWFKRDQYESGRIALQQHVGKPSIEIRKIEIKELADSAPSPVAGPKAAVRPFDKDALVAPFDESQAKAAQQKWADRLKTPVDMTNTIGLQLRLVPAGEYRMGADDGAEFQKPEHTVRITHAFYLGTYEVTRGQFARFVAGNHQFKTRAERSKGGGWKLDNNSDKRAIWDGKHPFTWRAPGFPQDDSHPVVNVSWDDAEEFCAWLSKVEGKTYRLPTEAEWEYACRAGTTTGRYNGRGAITEIANFADASTKEKFRAWGGGDSSDGYLYTSPVGQFRPNSFGLYDMLGNALEWCHDWYDDNYYKTSPEQDPPGPQGNKSHSVRGGAFTGNGAAGSRWHWSTDHHAPDCGFRVVCEIPTAPAAAGAPKPAEVAATAPAADVYRCWQGGKHVFERIASGKWRETDALKASTDKHFDEVRATREFVELIEARESGGVRLRIYSDRVVFCYVGTDTKWRKLYPGHWVSKPAEVPVASPDDRSPDNGSPDQSFFNSNNLDGWHGLRAFWHVKDHALVGTVPVGQKAHTFLCSKREYKDFELKFRARLLGGVGNSGVNFRSKWKDPQKFTVVGPQCEICGDDGKRVYPTGSLVSEPHGKPAVAPPADQVARIFKEADFNDFEIRCVGQHVRIKLNGQTTVDADFPSMPDAGVIAWQMHGNRPPKEVTFKDIEFTDLSAPPARVDGP